MTLDTKLNQERAIKQLLKIIPITEQAYRKAHRYVDLSAEMAGFKVELYGYLTMSKNAAKGVVTDVYLSCGQTASPTKCHIDPRGEYDTHMAIKNAGNVVVGWWHSHKGLRLHSHSDEDDYNFSRVMQFMFGNNKRTVVTEENFVGSGFTVETQDDTVKISEPNGTMTIELLLPESTYNKFLLPSSLQGLRLTRTLTFECAYSLILIDDYNKPYCEVAVRDPLIGEVKISKEATLSFVETPYEHLDDRLLKEHISSRVRFNRYSNIYIPESLTDFKRPRTKKTKTEEYLTGVPDQLVKAYSLIVGLDLENSYGRLAASDSLIKRIVEAYTLLLPYTFLGVKHIQIPVDAINSISDLMEKVRVWSRKQLSYWLDIEGITSQKIRQLELRYSESSRGIQKKTRKALKMLHDKHEQNKRIISDLEIIVEG